MFLKIILYNNKYMSLNKFTNDSQKDWLIINASSLICKDGVKTSKNQQHSFKPPILQTSENNGDFMSYNHNLLCTEWTKINKLEISEIFINNNTITNYIIDKNHNYYIYITNPNEIINILLDDDKTTGSILNFVLKIDPNSFTINFIYNSNIIYTKYFNIQSLKYYNIFFLKDDVTYILY